MVNDLEKVEVIEIDAGNSSQTIAELKQEIKSLRAELENCTIGSDEFTSTLDDLTSAQEKLKNATKKSADAVEGSYDALVSKMSELKKAWKATADEAERADLGSQINEINTQLKDLDASLGNYQRNVGDYASAFDNVTLKIEGGVAKFEKFNKVSRSIIGSFDLVEGGLKAIGVESEEVNELMDSMQGAMMLTNGLNSIKEGVQAFTALRTSVTAATTAQHALNAAQMANPIGAVVTAVAALIAGITTLVRLIRKNKDEEDALRLSYESTTRAMKERVGTAELEIELMKARGKSQSEVLKAEKALAEANVESTKVLIEELKKKLDQLSWFNNRQKKLLKEQIEDQEEKLAEYEAAVIASNNRILIYNEQLKTENIKKAKEEAEEQARLKKEAAEKLKADNAAVLDYIRRQTENQYKLELEDYKNFIEEKKQILRDAHDAGLLAEKDYLEGIFQLDVLYGKKEAELNEQAGYDPNHNPEAKKPDEVDKQKTLQQAIFGTTEAAEKQAEVFKASAGIASTAFGNVSQVLNTLAGNQDKTTKEGFESYKKLSIAAATMQMFQGIISAWTSSMSLPMPFGAITAGVMTAATATMGALQINSIKKQTFEGSGGSTPTPTLPSINTAALIGNPVNYTTEVQGANTEESIPTRVYVVESDITTTQNNVRVTEDESTF